MKKILVIEDDEYLRLVIERFLKSQGFNVLTAENGFIGLVLAKEQKPDLIVCDIKMPVLDGYGVLENLRKDFKIAKIPVFFISFYADEERIERAYQLGVNDYLKKPVDLNELLAKIEQQLKLS
ncbi:MAG TPA: response regulator [Cyanobacteria bacterium UBA11369]|nr:response regulator [Cyanobacteria bacterium UBA11371]HBE49558.1 response regulator [Cyanobacteria bacterium UBA11369]